MTDSENAERRYITKARFAKLLDCSTTTVDDYVARGFLPLPVQIGTLKRWDWIEVQKRIATSNQRDPRQPANILERDPILIASRG